MSDTMIGKHVVVTTAHRGVFFGKLESESGDTLTLTDARVCVYWDASTRGYLGLAANGPGDGCRISPGCPRLRLNAITSVSQCTAEAVAKWEAAPWS